MSRLVAVHRCPAWPKAARDDHRHGEVEIGVREDDGGVLAAHLGLHAHAAAGELSLQIEPDHTSNR